MIELSAVLDTLATIWALVGCLLGLYLLIGMVGGLLKMLMKRTLK